MKETTSGRPTRWRNTFPSAEHLHAWTEKYSATTYAQRDLDQWESHPQSKGAKEDKKARIDARHGRTSTNIAPTSDADIAYDPEPGDDEPLKDGWQPRSDEAEHAALVAKLVDQTVIAGGSLVSTRV